PADLQSASFGRSDNLAGTIRCGSLLYYAHLAIWQIGRSPGVTHVHLQPLPAIAQTCVTSPRGRRYRTRGCATHESREYPAEWHTPWKRYRCSAVPPRARARGPWTHAATPMHALRPHRLPAGQSAAHAVPDRSQSLLQGHIKLAR